jgi:hypothetical protein
VEKVDQRLAREQSPDTTRSPIFKLGSITLRSGLSFKPGQLTVAIGPNNGGKSEFLNDVVSAVARPDAPRKSVQSVEMEFPIGPRKVIDALTAGADTDPSGHLILDGPDPDFSQPRQMRYQPIQLGLGGADRPEDVLRGIVKTHLGRRLVSHLTTEQRLLLVKRQINRAQNVEGPLSPLEAAYEAPADVMKRVYDPVFSAFGHHLVLDKARFATLEFRLGDTAAIPEDPAECIKHLSKFPRLDEQGDGIRSFTGVLVAAAAALRPVVAIDEPEAFLHPPQAFLVGKALAALRSRTQLFIATHSAEVLRGILTETQDVNVIRFSQREGIFHTKSLDIHGLRSITGDPVLKSARVLDGLFYNGVVVTESDGDVALYRAVLDDMDTALSVTFINSYSKQSSTQVAKPFHAMDVPCALIVDFDGLRVRHEFRTLYEGAGGAWSDIAVAYDSLLGDLEGADTAAVRLQNAAGLLTQVLSQLVSQGDAQKQLSWLQKRIKDVRESASEWADAKKRGRDALSAAGQTSFDVIDRHCRALGLFIVPCGEREAWLVPGVKYTKSNKRAWTDTALRYIGANPLQEGNALRAFASAVQTFCAGAANAGAEVTLGTAPTV